MSKLTEQQREVLRRQLSMMRQTLEARLKDTAREQQPVSLDQPIGRLTRMDAIQQQQMAVGQQRRVETELQQVKAALERIEQQHYGLCLRCHDSIPYERLQIRPTTTLCYECQCELETRARICP
jgi:DnaK suppressor protein